MIVEPSALSIFGMLLVAFVIGVPEGAFFVRNKWIELE